MATCKHCGTEDVRSIRRQLEARVAEMENVARLVMIAHAIDWKAQTDDESDRAWGEAIRAAQQARGDATDHEVDDEERRA